MPAWLEERPEERQFLVEQPGRAREEEKPDRAAAAVERKVHWRVVRHLHFSRRKHSKGSCFCLSSFQPAPKIRSSARLKGRPLVRDNSRPPPRDAIVEPPRSARQVKNAGRLSSTQEGSTRTGQRHTGQARLSQARSSAAARTESHARSSRSGPARGPAPAQPSSVRPECRTCPFDPS